MKMNIQNVMKRAKDQGIQLLAFQMTPTRRLFFTGNDADVPAAIGEQVAWAALKLADLSGEDPKVVMDSILDLAMVTANKRIKEQSSDMSDDERKMREYIRSQMAGEDEEEDLDLDLDNDSSEVTNGDKT